ncbi:MAG: CHAT domain-containing protein, partial [Lysobacterales bacterium]
TIKIDSLTNAGKLFEQYGMQEMRLWANYLAAHHVLFYLHDHSIAYSMTRDILSELKGTRLQKIELATLQLQGMALMGLRKSGSLNISKGDSDPVQAVLSRTAELARSMGYEYELARALYDSGLEYAGQSSNTDALDQFQQAVQIADGVGSTEMAKAIRESIVQVHTVLGDAPASSEVLQEIESQLVEDGGGDELALNLLAQARLLIGKYRYREALKVLSGALAYQNNSAIRRQIYFELAKILYETGRMDDSLKYLQLAGINPDSSRNRRVNPVVDVGEGLQILANIYRYKGEFERMQTTRSAQGQYRPATDQYLYDQGMDALATPGDHRQRAASLLRRSFEVAGPAGHDDIEHLAQLHYCVLTDPADGLCSNAALNRAHEWLIAAAVPRVTSEAMYVWVQLLLRDGRRGEANAVMEGLIDDIHVMRFSLPGVLGSWYWERHEQIFETWLGMLISESRQRGSTEGSASLLALSKMRFIEGTTESYAGKGGEADSLRTLLAQRADPGAGQSRLTLNEKIMPGLDKLRADFHERFAFLSDAGLKKYLRSLAEDETVMTYHLGPRLAQVWIANKNGVQRRDIADPAKVYQGIQTDRLSLADIGLAAFDDKMDELGKQLLQPVADLLTDTIYAIPAGPLLGVPLDALRFNGHYLVERHNVVNLLSFPQNVNPASSLQTGLLQSVFLAGNPMDYAGDYATRLETSAEISAVADLFVGPGLQIVQGVALLPDEFQSDHFSQSNLVHLSMPGVINLEHPDQSGLELSESEYEPGRAILLSPDIRSQNLGAGLVFLSSLRLSGIPRSGFSSQPGLVADFMAAGAESVIVNLWAGDAGSNVTFITSFYRSLKASANTAAALRNSRLEYLESGRDDGNYDWAGYQLYIK